jgi:hypothetical protein
MLCLCAITDTDSANLENALPKLFVFWEFLNVIDGQHIGRRGANFLEGLHVGVGGSLSGLNIDFLASSLMGQRAQSKAVLGCGAPLRTETAPPTSPTPSASSKSIAVKKKPDDR